MDWGDITLYRDGYEVNLSIRTRDLGQLFRREDGHRDRLLGNAGRHADGPYTLDGQTAAGGPAPPTGQVTRGTLLSDFRPSCCIRGSLGVIKWVFVVERSSRSGGL
jgi:hypothetical protein